MEKIGEKKYKCLLKIQFFNKLKMYVFNFLVKLTL